MKNSTKKYSKGFTLIEVMVTVAIVGIFASLALPSFSRLIENNQVSTATNELVSNLLLTRSEALKRRNTVALCPSVDQSSCSGSSNYSTGWIVFLDCDSNGLRDAGVVADCGPNDAEDIIKVHEQLGSVVMNNATQQIRFGFSGRPLGDNSTFNISGVSATPPTRTVVISLIGRVRSQD